MTDPRPPRHDDRWDEAAGLLREPVSAIGYHTRLAPGTDAHPTRESLAYAVALLESGDPARLPRVQRIVRTVLALQVTDPTDPAFGVWPWYAEEPVARMAPPDWNWADFLGARLLDLLHLEAGRLEPALVADVRTALRNAAYAIFRRNTGPSYTNICAMGAAVTLAAGERLGDPLLLDYGRRRLTRLRAHAQEVGGFTEYNSPMYTMVAAEEFERVLRLCTDPAGRAEAEALLRLTWGWIADHFHPGTAQWAGPNARTYSDRLEKGPLAWLRARTGVAIPAHPSVSTRDREAGGRGCPPDLVDRFRRLPSSPLGIRQRFACDPDPAREIVGTTWMDDDACLGTVTRGTTWIQSRPALAYWRGTDEPAAVLRLRCLRDGRDFASGLAWCAQRGPRALVACGLATDQGDHHCFLDRPADGRFHLRDLRLRWWLAGRGARAELLGDGRWTLSCGGRAVQLAAVGEGIRFAVGGRDDEAWVDAILVERDAEEPFAPAAVERLALAFALDVAGGAVAPPTGADAGGQRMWSWDDLTVRAPLRPGPF